MLVQHLLKLSPVDYKAVIDSLNQAKNRIQELNPFKALGTFFNDYLAAKKKLRKAEADHASGKGTQRVLMKPRKMSSRQHKALPTPFRK